MQYRQYPERKRSSRVAPKRRSWRKLAGLAVVLMIIGVAAGYAVWRQSEGKRTVANAPVTKKVTSQPAVAVAATAKPAPVTPPVAPPPPIPRPEPAKPNPCAANGLAKLALVSIGQRHLWACAGTTVAYDSPVVTGMEKLAADLTPTGTYHIYGKQTDLYLNGADSTGSWHDHVSYWMPFLDNQYGAYGFHDATWRSADAFGNISPDSSDASHGCVELPLATATWLYDWADIGTTVTIES
jgi:lipoprotein-anchoring transpeptidase ErfK/SrfK